MCCLANSSCRPAGFLSWLASWLTFPICPLVSAPLAILSTVRSVRSGSAWAMTRSTLFSPFIVVTMCVAAGGIRDYAKGKAALHPETCTGLCGKPAFDPSWSIDTRSRLPIERRMPRCGASRFMWRVNDRVVRVLSRVLGPQEGSYTGVIPSVKEAGEALRKGRPAEAADFRSAPDLCVLGCTGYPAEQMVSQLTVGGREPRVGVAGGLKVIGTGETFFVLIDPATGREVARYWGTSR